MGRRASRLETVGAWLGMWTPPRDVEVPRPTRRGIVAALLALALTVAAIALIVAPRVDRSKQRAAAQERADATRRSRVRRRQLTHDQRASSATVARQPRAHVIAAVEALITADVRHRVALGELRGSPKQTSCSPVGKPARNRVALDCFTSTETIKATERNVAGAIGFPFRAVVDFQTFKVAWCKTNPVPGERVVPDPSTLVALPSACRLG